MRVLRLPESVDPLPALSRWGRVLTAAVAVPIVVLLTIFAPNSIFALVLALVAAAAVEEFLALAAKRGIGRPGRWFLIFAASVAMSFLGGSGFFIYLRRRAFWAVSINNRFSFSESPWAPQISRAC